MVMADLTPELLDRLEEIAKAATPGPWCLNGGTAAIAATYGRQKIFCTHVGGTYPAADAKHIAAASPDVVLALVEAARERGQLSRQLFARRGEVERLLDKLEDTARRVSAKSARVGEVAEAIAALPALVADARKLATIRAILDVDNDGPEGPMSPRWILGQIEEVIDGGT
jgi:hypothetical protein